MSIKRAGEYRESMKAWCKRYDRGDFSPDCIVLYLRAIMEMLPTGARVILGYVLDADHMLTPTEIAEKMGKDVNSVTPQLGRLRKHGLVAKSGTTYYCPDDYLYRAVRVRHGEVNYG